MTSLTIHIGTQKTGTSVLQEFCSLNREKLSEQGLSYVMTGRGPKGQAAEHAQHVLAHYWVPGWLTENFPEGFEQSVWNNFKERLYKETEKRTLISSEHFYKASTVKPEMIQGIRDELPDVDIEVIVYFRRPDQFALSNWAHGIKTIRNFGYSFEEYIETPALAELLSYNKYLKLWQDVFGADKVTAKIYDRKFFKNGDIIDDFFEILGVERTEDMENVGDVNISLSPFTLEFLHDLDRVNITRYFQLVSTLERYASNHIPKDAMKQYKAMTDELANRVLDRFGEEFHEVSKYVVPEGIDIDSLRPDGKHETKISISPQMKEFALELWHPVPPEEVLKS